MAMQVPPPRGPLMEASGSAWSKRWPQKAVATPRELASLEEELDEAEGEFEDEGDEGTCLDPGNDSHFRPYGLQEVP